MASQHQLVLPGDASVTLGDSSMALGRLGASESAEETRRAARAKAEFHQKWNNPNRNADDSEFMRKFTLKNSAMTATMSQLTGNPRERRMKANMERNLKEQPIFHVRSRRSYGSQASFWMPEQVDKANRFVYTLACCIGIWAMAASGFLFAFPLLYGVGAVDKNRERFLISMAERVEVQASGALSTAVAARDVVHYAVKRRLFSEPSDYHSIRVALAPLFTMQPTLRAVELAFLGQNHSVVVRRLFEGADVGGAPNLLVQSDAASCAIELGPTGCIAGVAARNQEWVELAEALPCGQEVCEGAGQASGFLTSRWMDAPGFVPWDAVERPIEHSVDQVQWAPAYSLIFRSVFPGSGGNLSVVGRATLDISRLQLEADLSHSSLGSSGGVFLCDKSGIVLSAAEMEQLCVAEGLTGRVRFRYAWELGYEWAAEVQEEDFVQGRRFVVGSVQISVAPLARGGLEHFSVIVAAERERFADENMVNYCFLCQALCGLPYLILLVVIAPVYINERYRNWQRGVQPFRERHSSLRPAGIMHVGINGFQAFRRRMRRGSFAIEPESAKTSPSEHTNAGRSRRSLLPWLRRRASDTS